MALITEDGTGLATAESLCSVTDATTYHAAMGNAAWAALTSDAIREQCLRKATAYMEGRYRDKYSGMRKATTQALSWPRVWVPIKDAPIASYYATDSVPSAVKNACAELALKSATAELLADQTQGEVSNAVGAVSVSYDPFSPQETRYMAIYAMLKPYLSGNAGAVEMVRV